MLIFAERKQNTSSIMTKQDINILKGEDIFSLIGKEWMLVTAGTEGNVNTMTASWGGMGWLWNKPVAFVFIRPERYTHDFVERTDRMTLSFLGEKHRKALQLCGSVSGRDRDKIGEAGLTPVVLQTGATTFAEARLVLDCRKLYKADMSADGFIDSEVLARWYNDKPGGGLHTLYIAEIEGVYA